MDFFVDFQAVDQFINELKNQGRSQFTLIAYKKDLQQFVGYLIANQKTDFREVVKENIDDFIKKLITENYTKKSASRKLNSIRSFFRFLKRQGIISHNPALEISHPKYDSLPPRFLSRLEYCALRDAAKNDPRSLAMIEILLQTGIKISEMTNIKISDIKNGVLVVSLGKQKREIPLNNAVKKAIDLYLKTRKNISDDQFLFITRSGRQVLIRNVRQIISRYLSNVGIKDATVNDLRNTFIVHQLIRGASLEYVSRIVGHRRLSSTERYLSLVNNNIQKKKEKIEEL